MRLKEGFILHDVNGESVAVATRNASLAFNGMIRNNKTSAFILDMLLHETSDAEIIDEMCKKYEAPKEVIEKDVEEILEKLRQEGLLDE